MISFTTAVALYAAVAWRAFFFKPPVTLVIGGGLTLASLVFTVVPIVGLILVGVALLGLVGWHIYYICKDWKSRSLRWVVSGFLACAVATGALIYG